MRWQQWCRLIAFRSAAMPYHDNMAPMDTSLGLGRNMGDSMGVSMGRGDTMKRTDATPLANAGTNDPLTLAGFLAHSPAARNLAVAWLAVADEKPKNLAANHPAITVRPSALTPRRCAVRRM